MNMLQRLGNQLFSGIVPETLTLPVGGPCFSCGCYVVDDDDPIFHPPKIDPEARYFASLPYWMTSPQPRMRTCERCNIKSKMPWMLEEEIDQWIARIDRKRAVGRRGELWGCLKVCHTAN